MCKGNVKRRENEGDSLKGKPGRHYSYNKFIISLVNTAFYPEKLRL
jgi:hypothetical protein